MKVNLDSAAAEARREYFRQWRRNNPEKIKQHQANYWKKKAREMGGGNGANANNHGSR